MPHISHAEAQQLARASGRRLTAKDLETRWGMSRRTVQRARKEFALKPVDFYGNNPLFDISDVEAAEKKRREKRLAICQRRSKSARKQIGGILTLKQLRAKAKR